MTYQVCRPEFHSAFGSTRGDGKFEGKKGETRRKREKHTETGFNMFEEGEAYNLRVLGGEWKKRN